MGRWLDLMAFEVFSKLKDSVILRRSPDLVVLEAVNWGAKTVGHINPHRSGSRLGMELLPWHMGAG